MEPTIQECKIYYDEEYLREVYEDFAAYHNCNYKILNETESPENWLVRFDCYCGKEYSVEEIIMNDHRIDYLEGKLYLLTSIIEELVSSKLNEFKSKALELHSLLDE